MKNERENSSYIESKVATEASPYMFLDPERLLKEKERFRKMTVATIAPAYLDVPPEDYGGTENVINNIARSKAMSLLKRHQVFALRNSKIKDIPNVELHPSIVEKRSPDELIGLLRTDHAYALKSELHHVRNVYKQLAKLPEVNIVHDHTDLGRTQIMWLKKEKPVLITQHGLVGRDRIHRVAADFYEDFNDQNVWSIAISENQRLSNTDMKWLAVIPNGIDLAEFEFKVEKGHKDDYDSLGEYGLFMGRIAPDKGLLGAIDTAEAVGMPLVIAGPIENQKYFMEKILPRIEANSSKIIYIGKANKDQRKILMANASWFSMLVNWEEPFGMVVAEAMASGTPVVATRRGAVPEIMGDVGGVIVDDPKDAPSELRQILNEGPEKRLIRALLARKRVEMNFSTDIMAAKYALAFLEAIDRASGASNRTGIMEFPNFSWAEKAQTPNASNTSSPMIDAVPPSLQ